MASRDRFVREARERLRDGKRRDDVYHATVRWAAQHQVDRYDLWHEVVTSGTTGAKAEEVTV